MSLIETNTLLLSEFFRPQSLEELNLPDSTIYNLQRQINSGQVMNMLFYGSPGIGKTSAVRIILKELGADPYELNGSFNDGEKTMVRNIETFTHTVSLTGQPKICFIDEADFMTRGVQDSLRYVIEEVSNNARFLLTANDLNRLTPAIRSRCLPVCFDVQRKDIGVVIDKMVQRYSNKLSEMEIDYDPVRLKDIVGIYYPDLRMISNVFQMEFL